MDNSLEKKPTYELHLQQNTPKHVSSLILSNHWIMLYIKDFLFSLSLILNYCFHFSELLHVVFPNLTSESDSTKQQWQYRSLNTTRAYRTSRRKKAEHMPGCRACPSTHRTSRCLGEITERSNNYCRCWAHHCRHASDGRHGSKANT
jgi:hypothetical protein